MTVTGRFIIPEAESYTHFAGLLYDLLEDRCTDNANIAGILLFYYLEQIYSKLLCFCVVRDQRRSQNVVRTSVTHTAVPCVPLFKVLTTF